MGKPSKEMIKDWVSKNGLTQTIIDAYEMYVWNVKEAIRFIEMGVGKNPILNMLKPLIEQHEIDMYEKIENKMDELNKETR